MRCEVLFASALAAGSVSYVPVASGQFAYTATVLTAGSGGSNNTIRNIYLTDIGDDGLISGYSINPNTFVEGAQSWTPGNGYQFFQTKSASSYYGIGRATGVSSNGYVSGYVQNGGVNNNNGGFVYYGGATDENPGNAAGNLYGLGITQAYDVNADGRIIGLDNRGRVVTYDPNSSPVVQTVDPGTGVDFVTSSARIRPAFSINDQNASSARSPPATHSKAMPAPSPRRPATAATASCPTPRSSGPIPRWSA